MWWIPEPDPAGAGKQDIYAAMGYMGQYIFLVPEHEMVVVFTGGTRNGNDRAADMAVWGNRVYVLGDVWHAADGHVSSPVYAGRSEEHTS